MVDFLGIDILFIFALAMFHLGKLACYFIHCKLGFCEEAVLYSTLYANFSDVTTLKHR